MATNCDADFQSSVKTQSMQMYIDKKNNTYSMDFVMESFRKNVKTGPRFVCSVCHRQLFRKQVIECKHDRYTTSPTVVALAKKCITETIYRHVMKNVMMTALLIFNHLSCGYVTHVTVKYVLVECLNKV